MTCDVMGGLYLAYDLLGGENGPLARLTKCVNYTLLMTLLLLTTMGLKFALIVGVAFGTAMGLHMDRVGRGIPDTNLFYAANGLLTGVAITCAFLLYTSPALAIVMGLFVFALSIVLPKCSVSPATIYQSAKRPQLNWKTLMLAVVVATIAFGSGLLSVSITHGDARSIHFVLKFALTFGAAVLAVTTLSPLIEWYSDNLPPKSFGTGGVILFICGFVIQAIPSFATIFDLAK